MPPQLPKPVTIRVPNSEDAAHLSRWQMSLMGKCILQRIITCPLDCRDGVLAIAFPNLLRLASVLALLHVPEHTRSEQARVHFLCHMPNTIRTLETSDLQSAHRCFLHRPPARSPKASVDGQLPPLNCKATLTPNLGKQKSQPRCAQCFLHCTTTAYRHVSP